MKADIDLYENKPDSYDKLQMLRPDYMGAKSAFLDLALKHLEGKKNIVLADFCSGTGINTKLLAGRLPVSYAVLIDTNKKFIEIAKKSEINTKLETHIGDILKVDLTRCADAVISMFAYHHITNTHKADYIEKIKDVLKQGGILLLGEIYIPNKETTIEYYKHLYSSIAKKSPELESFLMQTANSDHYEYKVAKEFADKQLIEAGFELIESKKIWPVDSKFDKTIGTFVEAWKLK
jgi:ubiquinone/menaquinone biosynthesis C-methylase UbiE